MLRELALLLTLLTLFADALPLHQKHTVEMSDEVEENSDSLANRDDILEGKDRARELSNTNRLCMQFGTHCYIILYKCLIRLTAITSERL